MNTLLKPYEEVSRKYLEEIWSNVLSGLCNKLPFIWFITRKLTVVYDPKFFEAPASVDDRCRLILGPLFLHLSKVDKTSVVAHEVLHVALEHLWRMIKYVETRKDSKNIDEVKKIEVVLKTVFNLAADAIVNELLKDGKVMSSFYVEFSESVETSSNKVLKPSYLLEVLKRVKPSFAHELERNNLRTELVSFKTLKNVFKVRENLLNFESSVEEIADEILKNINVIVIQGYCFSDINPKGVELSDKAIVIQKGEIEEKIEKDKIDPREVVKEVVREAFIHQKLIGKLPLGLARVLEKLFESKIPWRHVLRSILKIAEGSNATIMWHLQNPVFGTVPDYLHLGVTNILWLVDTSGSISKTELEQIASEIQSCSKLTQVIVIPWDVDAYDPIICRRPSECVEKLKIGLKGGGGTIIKPALKKAIEIARKRRPHIVIIASDGYIGDLIGKNVDEETIELIKTLRSMSLRMIFITTDIVPKAIEDLGFIDIVKLDVEE